MSTINIKINDQQLQVPAGETVLNACKSAGIDIPHLCHDPKLKPFSSCFVCVVEIKGYRTHQPSCSTVVQEGMEIYTDSPSVHKSRKTALELLLSNHYADCVAPCKLACPESVDVQGYLSLIEKGLNREALELIKEVNPLPAICGRVCVRPCEAKCRRQLTEDKLPVGIDYLKRFVADIDLASDNPHTPEVKPQNGKKVAIVGGGPAGLTAAYYLQIAGFQADVYERQPAPGGWLRYGIPEYRLPNSVLDDEFSHITKLGVNIFCNRDINSAEKFGELDKNYDAIFLAIGAQNGDLLGVGEKPAPNLVSGIDFLKNNAQIGNDTDLRGKKVVVVGGGNTAMDCCRSARRCGSTDVLVLYRRTEADMPANPIEIHESKVEGVKYEFLAAPVGVYYDEKGNLTGLKCVRMKAEKLPGSRRSNIVPIEGSEFDLPCDLVLPATGQKIQYNIIDQINEYYKPQELQLNKWKTLDANETTMQMSIPKIFAAGDAVTGPANIIQAIAGGAAAATYIESYVLGTPPASSGTTAKPFISTRDNFEKQQEEDYQGKYVPCKRYEMPVLPENERNNFNEVELGYQDPQLAVKEAERCLECGCAAFYDCKLQQYATRYGAVQTRYKGRVQKFTPNLQHPRIEMDNHKCILCGRCVRVCREYSGNKAWEFIKRGSKTFVAPNLEGNLVHSRCDACGLCTDTCPTGALTENLKTKVLPLPYKKLPIIDPFGSEGFEVDLLSYKGRIYGATAREGAVNRYGLIARDIKFGYGIFNRKDRITQPLLRENGQLVPITPQQAIEKMKLAVAQVKPEENAVFLSPTLTNEAIFALQKWAKEGVKTDALGSAHYFDKGFQPHNNLSLSELSKAKHIYIFGAELSLHHPVVSHIVQNLRFTNKTPVTLITNNRDSQYLHRVDEVIFVDDFCDFAKGWTAPAECAVIFSEKETPIPASFKAKNVMLLRAACNSQGLFDMGVVTPFGGVSGTTGVSLGGVVGTAGVSLERATGTAGALLDHAKNIFVFGENPVTTPEVGKLFKAASFLCVQSFFENETTAAADLVLPLNFAIEIGGSYTSTFGVVQKFDAVKPCEFGWNDYRFYEQLLKARQ